MQVKIWFNKIIKLIIVEIGPMYLKRTVLTFNGVYPSVFSYISFYSPLNDLLKVFI